MSSIFFEADGAGAVERPLADKVGETLSALDYGATGDGVTDDTAAMLAFFNACIDQGRSGYIPAGTYLITLGQLLFDNGNVRTQWPNIMTAGAEAVTFVGDGTANLPIIEFRNGTYVSGPADNFWIGGHLGGITFETATATAGTNRHGIKAYGMYGTRFGHMRGNALGGSTIHLKDQKYGTNPDYYAMGYCVFELVEGYGNTVRTFDNQNGVGMNFCSVNGIRGIGNVGGVLYGLGASNQFKDISAGSCTGWAIKANATADAQLLDRSLIEDVEIDDCEYGIDLEYVSQVDIRRARFIHRYHSGPDDYWPRLCINLADNSGAALDVSAAVLHRIEAGGDEADLGVFVDGNSSGNIGNVRIDQRITHLNGFTIAGADFYTAVHPNAQILLSAAGIPILDQMPAGVPIGYRLTDGGAIEQETSRTAAVTLHKPCGQITLFSAAGSTSPTSFTVNNSFVTSGDTIQLSQKSGTDKYRLSVTAVGSGAFEITYATWAGTTVEKPVFTFAIINAEAS